MKHEHAHDGAAGQGHSHGLVDPSIIRSREGVRAVSISLVVLLATTLIQIGVFLSTNS
ncbi:MAG: cation transporter, partial [Actinobacteria bacterium]|nr:cation transporter [Actinomycetota bacterium]